MRKKKQSLSPYLLFSIEDSTCQRWAVSVVAEVIYCISLLHSVWLMTPSRPNKCLHIPAECLFAFTFCSFFHMHPPLAGVEFNGLVSSDLQILDSQGATPPRTSFLPGPELLQTKLLGCMLCPPHDKHSSLKSQRVLLSHRKTPSLCLVCWPCGLFSERVGFKQHIF